MRISIFDWARYQQLKTMLSDLDNLIDLHNLVDADVSAVLEGLPPDLTIQETCNAIVLNLCVVGNEDLLIEIGLVKANRSIGRLPDGHDMEELMVEFTGNAHRIEDWLRSSSGLMGLLSVEETFELSQFLKSHRPKEERPRGKLSAVTSLFRTGSANVTFVEELTQLCDEAESGEYGLAFSLL